MPNVDLNPQKLLGLRIVADEIRESSGTISAKIGDNKGRIDGSIGAKAGPGKPQGEDETRLGAKISKPL